MSWTFIQVFTHRVIQVQGVSCVMVAFVCNKFSETCLEMEEYLQSECSVLTTRMSTDSYVADGTVTFNKTPWLQVVQHCQHLRSMLRNGRHPHCNPQSPFQRLLQSRQPLCIHTVMRLSLGLSKVHCCCWLQQATADCRLRQKWLNYASLSSTADCCSGLLVTTRLLFQEALPEALTATLGS